MYARIRLTNALRLNNMKISQIISSINQVEKSKFITIIDKLCADAASVDKRIAKTVNKIDGQIKNASISEIGLLFDAVRDLFSKQLKESLSMASPQAILLINILTRDGNSVARISWIESLYTKEWDSINSLSLSLMAGIKACDSKSLDTLEFKLSLFHKCLKEAFQNDTKNNRQAKITDDERTILNVLATELNITNDEFSAIEHSIEPIPKDGILEALNFLRDLGILFISRKKQEVLVSEEIIEILNEIQGKDILDKHFLRILRTLSDAELSTILKNHDRKIRGVSRQEKISQIMHIGIKGKSLLTIDLFDGETNINQRKDRLKLLLSDLEIETGKIGTTLDERCDLIINHLNSCTDKELDALSASGFNELLKSLAEHFSDFNNLIVSAFELEPQIILDAEKLKALSISPNDILFLLPNNVIKEVRDSMGLPKKGNARQLILESFANATDRLIDNYELLARRDMNGIIGAGLDINEADIGLKFEEVTKAIFEELELNVDEDLRKEISTNKDKVDIVLSISEDDIIIGEAKTSKNGDFAKYSSTSRQVKSYVNKAENYGKRVAQVLIIAPSFSSDFVESAELDADINISLLEASGLKLILDAFRARRKPNFSSKLLTKGGLLKAKLIAKNI